MMSYDAYYKAREELCNLIFKDAFGPVDPEEVLQEPPLDTYVCGILWPKGTQTISTCIPENKNGSDIVEQSPDYDYGGDIDDGQFDVIREANHFRPSVMAISFALPSNAQSVDVSFSTGMYLNVDRSVEGKKYTLHDYRRVQFDSGCMSIALPKRCHRISLFDGKAVVQIFRRKQVAANTTLWTISVENPKTATQNEIEQNTSALFQCELKMRGYFLPIENNCRVTGDLDRQKQAFLYREKHSYAVGHGCSVVWDSLKQLVDEIKSTFLPQAIVSQMIAVTDEAVSCFRMAMWKEENREQMLSEFLEYIQRYSIWANGLHMQLQDIEPSFQQAAQNILDRIYECIERLREGVKVLQNNDSAWKAFCYMNVSMMRQSAKKRNQLEAEVAWYPFQLCYILMCIPDVSDMQSKWHDTVDLLWFPTGGGKTEAYLGVAAYTIFYRRLTKGDMGSGVTVLMRYTLRMLTAQQFERAAALICECELIRRQEKLGGGEISIGLWVGSEVTPNHVTSECADTETAETILEKLKTGSCDEVKASPAQLACCPYCGTPLLPHNAYTIQNNQLRTHCPNKNCAFYADLPVATVDDDIYRRRPTLVIGTIDKFARLAWEEKTGTLFAEDGVGLPPELLIQDELHLISGPLGSISGLYEIAIGKLCLKNGNKPKILASTATLCNATEQIWALYGKPAFQFPPSGFTADDSFFARIATSTERPQRLYLGYCETGGSLPDAIVRTFGVVKFAIQYMAKNGVDPKVIDQFWTNVGYFNSLKDLGSADTLIIDRVCAYAESLRRHKFSEYADAVKMEYISNEYEYGELTSRKSTREISEVRNQLDEQHYPSSAALNYVLSSNMLSVGIDINRLGLMTVYGQPKATAEYIQATSRVGRSNPGFVIVLLHMLRTRDKSHYEHFQAYHNTINKMVEPTSATPYACRTMDKALHAVFITLVRHECPELKSNNDAAKFRMEDPHIQQIYEWLISTIRHRSNETASYAEEILNDFVYCWNDAAINRGEHLQYQLLNKSENDTDVLLIPAERSDGAIFPPTMNSMRNVDTQSGVFLKRRS